MTLAPPRRRLTAVAVAALACAQAVALVGCASGPERRPVAELFHEALEASRIRNDPAEAAVAEARNARPQQASDEARRAIASAALFAAAPADGPHVSEVFIETDVRQALQALAAQSGATIIIDDLVRGQTSAIFNDAPLPTALRTILLPLGYVFAKRDDAWLVGAPTPDSSLFRHIAEVFEFRPEHLGAAELLELLPQYAKPFLRSSKTRNVLVVHAPRATAEAIFTELHRLDQPVPQVVIEAIVCAYAPEDRLSFGLDFEQGFSIGGDEFMNIGMSELAGSVLAGPAGAAGIKSFKFASAFLRALDTEGYISVRAAPRVMARDGERAVVHIGEETYFTVGDGNNLLRDLRPVQSGIILNILPRVRGSNVVIEIERAEVSDEVRPSAIVAAGDRDAGLPTIHTRRVSTTVQVRDGETIVIGGLSQRRRVDRVVKVPLLGDIPGLGLLFQRIDHLDEEREVAIFISPRIVRK